MNQGMMELSNIKSIPVKPSDLAGWTVKGILLTTYDVVDTGVLLKRLLPAWFGLGASFPDSKAGLGLYINEIDGLLKSVPYKVIINTCAHGDPGAFTWLLNRHFRMLSTNRSGVTQHSKLWLVWYEKEGREKLLMSVSSTNLTEDSFTNQMQLMWHYELKLAPYKEQHAQRNRATWGVLPTFLEELGKRSGGPDEVAPFIKLLDRVRAPGGVDFVCSIPGEPIMETASALKGRYTEVVVATPTIGSWTKSQLENWWRQFNRSKHTGWKGSEICLVCRPVTTGTVAGYSCPRDTIEHVSVKFFKEAEFLKGRWLHGKLYCFRNDDKYVRFLISSANMTRAAWGDGNKPPENFELGVLVKGENPQDFLGCLEPMNETPCLVHQPTVVRNDMSFWAVAAWNGQQIEVDMGGSVVPEFAEVVYLSDNGLQYERHVTLKKSIDWTEAMGVPCLLSTTNPDRCLPIWDARPDKFKTSPAQRGIPAADMELYHFKVCLGKYKYPVALQEAADEEEWEEATDISEGLGGQAQADYSVRYIVEARAYFSAIDSWQAAYDKAVGPFGKELVRDDGETLLSYFNRRREEETHESNLAPVFEVLAEEMKLRLKGLSL